MWKISRSHIFSVRVIHINIHFYHFFVGFWWTAVISNPVIITWYQCNYHTRILPFIGLNSYKGCRVLYSGFVTQNPLPGILWLICTFLLNHVYTYSNTRTAYPKLEAVDNRAVQLSQMTTFEIYYRHKVTSALQKKVVMNVVKKLRTWLPENGGSILCGGTR
jgi:hypothetical protein